MSPQNIEYEGRHRDVSETGRWISVLKELGPETVALHNMYAPKHGHDELCESEFISGPMSHTYCACSVRRQRVSA